MAKLKDLGVDVEDTIGRVRVPSYMIDSQGIVRWLNPAAEKLVGDVRGRHYTSVVAPEETQRAQTIFTRNLFGSPTGSDNKAVVIGADGERLSVEVSAVPVRSGNRVIGVFGQVKDIDEQKPFATPEHLTPRQTEVLRLLDRGLSTEQIAQGLHISIETVRNHIRAVLRAFDANSRLEAVAIARRWHLLANPSSD